MATASAEDYGRKLLGEVEVVGFDEIIQSLRLQNTHSQVSYFNFPPLDRLLHIAVEAKPHASKTNTAPPIIELTSLTPSGGKTHLLYYLNALSILPTSLGGKQSSVIIIDTDGHFSVDRLAAQLSLWIRKRNPGANTANINDTVLTCLKHVHIFRPQSLASTTATIESLPGYLFDRKRHFSFDRAVGFVAVDSASAFYWQDKAEMEDAAVLTATTTGAKPPPSQSGYAALASALRAVCKSLQCPAVITTWHLGLQQHSSSPHNRSVRPSLPSPFSNLPTLRLIVQRKPVRKFPPGISVTEAVREGPMRMKAVMEGGFECVVNEWDVSETLLKKLREGGGGFGFKIGVEGVSVEINEGEG